MRFTALAVVAAAAPAAAHLDWRETGCVSGVTDQGHLTTADVVPTIEAVECAVYNITGRITRLSTQQVRFGRRLGNVFMTS
jgi:hypothetical protein